MPRFAANLTWLFTEWPLLDRFAVAADAGFEAVEILFPYDHPADAIAARLERTGLRPVLFNCPPGPEGARGLAALAGQEAAFEASIATALGYAEATGTPLLHCMAGLASPDDPEAVHTFRRNLAWAAERVGASGRTLLIEPLNGRDAPGYHLADFARAEALIRDLALPNLRLQFDCYHRQILHGDVTAGLRSQMPWIGHVQIASVPSRAEPDDEELAYPFLFAELDRLGYEGFVGCEYRPRAGTLAGLGWFAPWRQ